MREWFERWGRPQQIQFDHGQPWCSQSSRLPSLFELWLVGLGIEVVWSRPHYPQDNGIVERSHRTTQSWSAPYTCRSLEQLQAHVDAAVQIQRQVYPNAKGLSRLHRYPQLQSCPRPYCKNQEDQLWSLQRVYDRLSAEVCARKVDASGRISLYNRNYTLTRALAGQTLWVRFHSQTAQWWCYDLKGQLVGQCPSLEINPEVICQLRVHRPSKRRSTVNSE